MVTKVEKRGAGFHMVSEANGHRSREEIVILAGEDLEVGTVLGQITASEKYVQVDLAAVDGSQSVAGVLYDSVFADGADAAAVAHLRDSEVLGAELVYPAGATQGNIDTINAGLVALDVIVR